MAIVGGNYEPKVKKGRFSRNYKCNQDIKLKNSMKKKIAKKRAAAMGNIRNISEKQNAEICFKKHICFVYKGLEC